MNITPSRCPSVIPDLSPNPRIPKSSKSPAHISENGISLLIVSFATSTVANIAHTPMTTIRLKILEPTTLLTASSLLPVREADTLTAVSGRDVPIATMVSPIMIDGTCSLFATLELPSTKEVCALDKQYKAYHKEYKHKGKWGIVNKVSHSFLLCSPFNSIPSVETSCYPTYLG